MSSCKELSTTDQSISKLLENHKENIEKSLKEMLDEKLALFSLQIASNIDSAVRELKEDIRELRGKTTALEEKVNTSLTEARHVKQQQLKMEQEFSTLEEKIEKLEMSARRDNLKFFNIPRFATKESYGDCAAAVLAILDGVVPGKLWTPDDIIQAHRLGHHNDHQGRPPPMIVKFSRWSDKMAVLTVGKEALKRKNVFVGNDLTERQRETIQEHKRRGLHAYYRGNRLVVEEASRRRGGDQYRQQQRWVDGGQQSNYYHDTMARSQQEGGDHYCWRQDEHPTSAYHYTPLYNYGDYYYYSDSHRGSGWGDAREWNPGQQQQHSNWLWSVRNFPPLSSRPRTVTSLTSPSADNTANVLPVGPHQMKVPCHMSDRHTESSGQKSKLSDNTDNRQTEETIETDILLTSDPSTDFTEVMTTIDTAAETEHRQDTNAGEAQLQDTDRQYTTDQTNDDTQTTQDSDHGVADTPVDNTDDSDKTNDFRQQSDCTNGELDLTYNNGNSTQTERRTDTDDKHKLGDSEQQTPTTTDGKSATRRRLSGPAGRATRSTKHRTQSCTTASRQSTLHETTAKHIHKQGNK